MRRENMRPPSKMAVQKFSVILPKLCMVHCFKTKKCSTANIFSQQHLFFLKYSEIIKSKVMTKIFIWMKIVKMVKNMNQ